MRKALIPLAFIGALAACNRGVGSQGPDEFSVVPQRPLTIPATNALPPPQPGGTNPADPRPRGEAMAAMGARGGT